MLKNRSHALKGLFSPALFSVSLLIACDEDSGSSDGDEDKMQPLVAMELEDRALTIPEQLDPRRSLFETNLEALEPFTLKKMFKKAAKNAGVKATAKKSYRRLIDTYNTREDGRFADGQHCDDEHPHANYTNPNQTPCGPLGCDAVRVCQIDDDACSFCSSDGQRCLDGSAFSALPATVCTREFQERVCSYDGRRLSDCTSAQEGQCDLAGCHPLGCEARRLCSPDNEFCIMCTPEFDQCVVDRGQPDTAIEEVCHFDFDGEEEDELFQACDFNVATGSVDNCQPSFACEQSVCGEFGCNPQFMCSLDFSFCVICREDLSACEISEGSTQEPTIGLCTEAELPQLCEFDVANLQVNDCEPSEACEAAQCGIFGCDAIDLCTPEFDACAFCSADGSICEFDGDVEAGMRMCKFDSDEICTVQDDLTIGDCEVDMEGICEGFSEEGEETEADFGEEITGGSEFDSGDEFGTTGGEEFSETATGALDGAEDVTSSTTFGVTTGGGGVTVSTGGVSSVGVTVGVTTGMGEEATDEFDDDFTDTDFDDDTSGDDFGEEGAGFGAINGSLLECPRIEAEQIDNLDEWFPISVVNRIDLAPADGSHCGQQRVVFANNSINRMFLIFEAQIANPEPQLGIAGCRPLAEFWAEQSAIDDPVKRGKRLAKAFFKGHKKLKRAGFKPFVNWKNYTFGTGQVRSNNFDQFPWTLREFKLVKKRVGQGKKEIHPVAVPVTYTPESDHWNDLSPAPNGDYCREAFLTAMEGLITDEPNAMSFDLPPMCMAAESRDDFRANFAMQLNFGSGQFEADIERKLDLLGANLTPRDIANRAQFAGACIGCHEQTNGLDLGNGVEAPSSFDFTHTLEFAIEPCPSGDGQCFAVSPALEESFLPHRATVLDTVLAQNYANVAHRESAEPQLRPSVPEMLQQLTSEDGLEGPIDVTALQNAERAYRSQFTGRNLGGGSARASH